MSIVSEKKFVMPQGMEPPSKRRCSTKTSDEESCETQRTMSVNVTEPERSRARDQVGSTCGTDSVGHGGSGEPRRSNSDAKRSRQVGSTCGTDSVGHGEARRRWKKRQ